MNKRQIGNEYEQRAVDYLITNGFCILERNYRNRYGEIDIIAKDGSYLVFIEVKYRRTLEEGHPTEAVNVNKMRRITRTAMSYIAMKRISENTPMRFDVISILGDEIELYKNAFEAVV